MRSELPDNRAQLRDCGTVDEFAGQSPNMWDAWQLCIHVEIQELLVATATDEKGDRKKCDSPVHLGLLPLIVVRNFSASTYLIF